MATAIRSGVIAESPSEPCAWPAFESLEERVRGMRQAVGDARHAVESAAESTASNVRAHPLRAMGVAIVAGAVIGTVGGFLWGWMARTRA